MTNVLIWLVVGLIAGFLASKVMSGRGRGLPADIVVGLIGALLAVRLVSTRVASATARPHSHSPHRAGCGGVVATTARS
jgi:uncharacterized membrane protein YeaQ/YmgE (transglycosylase-associated protein family)